MPELIAKSPWAGQSAVAKAGVTLTPLDLGPVHSVALFPAGAKGAAKALKTLGLAFPGPGEVSAKGEARLIWTGRDQAFLQGAVPPEGIDAHAAVTDQSDAWAAVRVSGEATVAALSRLIALDLRPSAFPVGRVVRSAVNHMNAIVLRSEAGVEVWVFRSMARTLWHELTEVQDHLDARAAAKV